MEFWLSLLSPELTKSFGHFTCTECPLHVRQWFGTGNTKMKDLRGSQFGSVVAGFNSRETLGFLVLPP